MAKLKILNPHPSLEVSPCCALGQAQANCTVDPGGSALATRMRGAMPTSALLRLGCWESSWGSIGNKGTYIYTHIYIHKYIHTYRQTDGMTDRQIHRFTLLECIPLFLANRRKKFGQGVLRAADIASLYVHSALATSQIKKG